MKIVVELNKDNVILGFIYLATEDYTDILRDNDNFTEATVESFDNIITFKTKYENGQLIQLEDYCEEYYENQRKDEQRFLIQSQLTELYKWFDNYDMQIKQYERNKRLNIEGTYHIDGEDYTIDELDEQALYVANQIKELRNQLQELDNIVIVDDSSEE